MKLSEAIRGFFNALERAKGYRHYWAKLHGGPTRYEIILGDNVEVVLHCEEIHHHFRYCHHSWLKHTAITYVVHGEVGPEAPPSFRDLFLVKHHIPQSSCRFCSRKYRHKTAVMAYLDHVYVHKKIIK